MGHSLSFGKLFSLKNQISPNRKRNPISLFYIKIKSSGDLGG
jgi:hypothetical protein